MARGCATGRFCSVMRTGQREILQTSEIPLKGAHNLENVLAAVCWAADGMCAGKDSPGGQELQGCRASPGIRGDNPRSRVLQRLESHQRRRDHQGS